MDTTDKHLLEQRTCVSNSDHTQTPNTSPITTNEQTRESPTVAIFSNDNKLLEPIIFETHVNEDQRLKTKYTLKTTLSHLAFWITKPKYVSIQLNPFLIHIKAHSSKKRTESKRHCVKAFDFKGLRVLQKRKTHLYFQPSLQCSHIFKKQILLHVNSHMRLRLTETAMQTRVNIRRLTYIGTLQPILSCKYLHTDDTIHNQPPHTSVTR